MNIDEFMQSEHMSSAFVEHDDFTTLYIRKDGTHIDLAQLIAKDPGHGAFSRLIAYLEQKYPAHMITVDGVANPEFAHHLPTIGFRLLSDSIYIKEPIV